MPVSLVLLKPCQHTYGEAALYVDCHFVPLASPIFAGAW
uniref:Uncharacterized protein n=1 Tax=Arundo donax TaxID=35708 RepID=A0A0A9HEV0_ARUDO